MSECGWMVKPMMLVRHQNLKKIKKHDIAIVIDRIVVKEGIRSRLFDSFEAALRLAEGYAIVGVIGQEEMLFSEHYACPYCGFTVGELEPRLFFI